MFDPKHEEPLEALEIQLRRDHALTPDLISNVIEGTRLPRIKRTGKVAQIDN